MDGRLAFLRFARRRFGRRFRSRLDRSLGGAHAERGAVLALTEVAIIGGARILHAACNLIPGTEKSFSAEGIEFPAGSFVIPGMASAGAIRTAVESLGLTAVALRELPSVPKHDADIPRIAIYTQWTGTQSLGWYRLTLDAFGVLRETAVDCIVAA